ncbi:MAG: RNA 2',3'-cyclic phosphodiesterase [Bacteroidota bacterium]|nr:RNA 2',3'-cyclic phosphodiesterase [Bacteroidota bacterium]
MKRLFVAIKTTPDPDFLKQYKELRASLINEKIKWVEDLNIHITLKFLGETEEKKIPDIEKALSEVAAVTESFSFSLKSLGIFGSRYDPRVIWTGIEPYNKLAGLMENVHAALEKVGFERDRQNLVPHLTLGRIKFLRDKITFLKKVDLYKSMKSQPLQAKSMILFESILKREGPQYIALKILPLKNPME